MPERIEPPEEGEGRSVDEQFARIVAGFEATGRGGGRGHRGRRASRLRRSVAATAVAALLALAGWDAASQHPKPVPLDSSPAGTGRPWADGAAAASPAPRAAANADDRYFAGSPAEDWADNEAGFTVPAAVALNGVSANEVAAGYRLLVRVMAAANLEATVLDGGSIADFTGLLDSSSRVPAQLEAGIAHPSAANDPTRLLTRFNPDTTRLVGHTVKVHGVMSAEPGPHGGSALLTADYVFVYAVVPASGAGDENLRVTVHRTVQLEVMNPSEYVFEPGKAWLYDFAADMADVRCYSYDGFVEPGFSRVQAVPDLTGVADPYATGNLLTATPAPHSAAAAGTCRAVAGG